MLSQLIISVFIPLCITDPNSLICIELRIQSTVFELYVNDYDTILIEYLYVILS